MHGFAFCIATAVALASALVAQGKIPELLERARILQAEDHPEQASAVLREALGKLGSIAKKPAREKFRRTIDARLADVDPCFAKRRKAYNNAAREIVKLSTACKRLKQFRLALHLLWEAEALDPAFARYPLQSLARQAGRVYRTAKKARQQARLQRARPAAAAKKPTFAAQDPARFKKDGWAVTPDGITSPAVKDSDPLIVLSKGHVHGDATVSVETRRSAAPGQAAFVFGGKNYNDYFIFELQYFGAGPVLAAAYHWNGHAAVRLGHRYIALVEKVKSNWLRCTVEVEGTKATFSVAGEKRFHVTCTRAPHGLLGLLISGSTKNKLPVKFRHLRIQQKIKPKASAADSIGALVDAAKALFQKRGQERAVIGLLEARSRIGEIKDLDGRQSLADRITRALAAGHKHHVKLEKARAAAVAFLVEVATAYSAAGWHRCARAVLEDAAAIDPVAVEPHLEQNRQASGR